MTLQLQRRSLPSGWDIIRPPHETSALAIQGAVVWAGGADGLTAIDRRSRQPNAVQGVPGMSHVRDLLIDRTGALWAAHSEGLARMAGGRWQAFGESDGLPPGPLTALYEASDGVLWIGGLWGVIAYDGRSFRKVRTGLGMDGVDVIFGEPNGALWCASSSPTNGGLVRFDGERWETWTKRPELPHPSVSAIFRDSKGTLWFGTGFGRRGGACGLKDGDWRRLLKADGLAGEKVRSFFEDRHGRFWVGSEYDGIAVFASDTRRVLTPQDGLAGWEVKEIVQDEDGVYWLGTEDGVSRIARLE